MKPKEIIEWLILLSITLSFVSSEYCPEDKTDITGCALQAEISDSVKIFPRGETHSLPHSSLNHRFLSKSIREFDFSKNQQPRPAHSLRAAKNIRNQRRQKLHLIRNEGKEMTSTSKTIPFKTSEELMRYTGNFQSVNYRQKHNKLTEMQLLRTTLRSKISNKDSPVASEDQTITGEKDHKRKSDKIDRKENIFRQRENRRFNRQRNKQPHENPGERTTLFKANILKVINIENPQEQKNSIRRENPGDVSRKRLTVRNRSNSRNKNLSENIEKGSTKSNSVTFIQPNELTRRLNIRSRVRDRNFNTLENNRFLRTETTNANRAKNNIRRIRIRSTEERKEDTLPLSATSTILRKSHITEVTEKNNNILTKAVSLASRDDTQTTLHRNVVRTTRKELINGRYINRNDRIMRENLRSYASRITPFQPTAKTDTPTEQNVRRISNWLPSETTQGRKSSYATYSHSNRLKVTSTENRNSNRSAPDRKENRLTTRGTDERKYSLKTNNIERLSEERIVVQVTRNRDNINNHHFGANRRMELKTLGDENGIIFDYGVRSHINIRTNRRQLSRTSARITAEMRRNAKRNTVESATRRTFEKRNDISVQRLVDRISVTSENKYRYHSRQVKEMSNADERWFVFSNRRTLMYGSRDQRRQRHVIEPGKIREVRNFERNTIFRINERNKEQKLIQYNEEKKVINRKNGMYQMLERDLRRHSFSNAMQIGKDINLLKLREEYRQSTRYHERHITDNRDERMKAARTRALQLRYNRRLSTEQITLRNIEYINPGKLTRNVPSFIRSDERTLLNLNMQVRMRTTERNGRGLRGKLDILRRYAGNQRLKPSKDNEFFTYVIKSFENKLSGKTIQDRVLRTGRNNRGSRNYRLEHLTSGGEGKQGSTDRASRRIRINVSSSIRNSDKRTSGDETRERRASNERNRRLFGDQSKNIERHDELKMANVRKQERLISTERSDVKYNFNKQNDSPMVPRNGRGFRGKETNIVRMERILKYNNNRNNLLLTVFYRKQDIYLQALVLKPVENDKRFTVSQSASKKFSFDKNTGNIRNYERAFFQNQRIIRNNQRALLRNALKINSNLNVFVVQQTLNRNIHSIHRNFQERNIPYKSHYSSYRRENERIRSLNQSASRRYDMRVERFLENARTESQMIRDRRTSEETKLDYIRQRISNYRLPKDTVLSHGTLGSFYLPKDIIFENRAISSPEIYSSEKGHLNVNEKWNMGTVFSLIAHFVLGLSIIMAASEKDPFKCTSLKQRLFDALTLRTEVY